MEKERKRTFDVETARYRRASTRRRVAWAVAALVTILTGPGIASAAFPAPPSTGFAGTCRAEVAVGRDAGTGMRFEVVRTGDPAPPPLLAEGGAGWGKTRSVTALAAGDVDGDGRAELAYGRDSGSGMRFEVVTYAGGVWSKLLADGGAGWGASRRVTALAMGDVDGDGRAELAYGRDSGTGMRLEVITYKNGAWSKLLADGGAGWGSSRRVTALAMGDVDGDGRAELAYGRDSGTGMRFEVITYKNGAWSKLLADGGAGWGSSRRVTALAMGDVDGDGRTELAYGRDAGSGMRFEVITYAGDEWSKLLPDGGAANGSPIAVGALAFGDFEGDGRETLIVGLGAAIGPRYFTERYADGKWTTTAVGGAGWGSTRGVTALATGDTDADGDDELAIGRDSGTGMRHQLLDWDGAAFQQVYEGGAGWGSTRGVTALAIPAGLSADGDQDGIGDCIEVQGFDADGDGVADVSFPGAHPGRQNLFLELDALDAPPDASGAGGHSHCPTAAAVSMLVGSLINAPVVNLDGTTGLSVYIDLPAECGVSVTMVGTGGATGLALFSTGGSIIGESGNEIIDFDGAMGNPATSFYDLKASNFDSLKNPWVRYVISGHQTNARAAANDCTSGWAPEGPGNDFIVTLGGTSAGGTPCWGTDAGGNSVGSDADQAGTILHELGHSIGLPHGGVDEVNRKPNHPSVMNYDFQACTVPAYPGIGVVGGCDFSRFELPPLDETDLDECAGLGAGLGLGAFDWNGDGVFDGATCGVPTANVVADLNRDRFCLSAGPNGTIDSPILGDDVVEGSRVSDGPNRSCETVPAPATDDTVAAGRSVGDQQVQVLLGSDDWSRIDLVIGAVEASDGVDSTEQAEARADLGDRILPDLVPALEGGPVSPGTVHFHTLAVENAGGGPALRVQVRVEDGAPIDLGSIPAPETVEQRIEVDVPPTACDVHPVAVRIDYRDYLGRPFAIREVLTIPLTTACPR